MTSIFEGRGPSKHGLFGPKEGSFGFQVCICCIYIYIYIFIYLYEYLNKIYIYIGIYIIYPVRLVWFLSSSSFVPGFPFPMNVPGEGCQHTTTS